MDTEGSEKDPPPLAEDRSAFLGRELALPTAGTAGVAARAAEKERVRGHAGLHVRIQPSVAGRPNRSMVSVHRFSW